MPDDGYTYILLFEAAPYGRLHQVFGEHMPGSSLDKLFNGAVVIMGLGGLLWNPDDAFLSHWQKQNASFVSKINAMTPLDPRRHEYFQASLDFFQTTKPAFYSSFAYDSVLPIGMAAWQMLNQTTLAQPKESEKPVNNPHINAMIGTTFQGASGKVRYTTGNIKERHADGWTVGAFNIRAKAINPATRNRK